MVRLYNKVNGCLLAAAIADAMGTPLETRTPELIKKDFGGGDYVYDYKETQPNTISAGMPFAYVSDDFSLSYLSAKHFVENHGVIDTKSSVEALLEWKNSPDTATFFEHYGGPSTRMHIDILEGKIKELPQSEMCCSNLNGTNGSGMKSWIAGLFNPGNPEKAARDAVTMCLPSHTNPISLASGCAIAAGVAKALTAHATADQVVEAGVRAARFQYERAMLYSKPSAGASVEKRILLAVEIGLKYSHDFERCIHEMQDLVGSGMDADESSCSAFGYLVAGGGDVMKTIYLGINAGNDADTTAVMASAMAGALYGNHGIEARHKEILEKANPWIDFNWMTDSIYALY